MKHIRVNLKSFYADILSSDVYLNGIIYEDNFEYPKTPRMSVLILPGGGYSFVSYREKDPVMFMFNALGYNSFSLDYSCHKVYPTPHLEVMCAMDYINKHSDEFKQKKMTTTLIGFSAGGHLACTYAYLYKELSTDENLKPYALVLAYPVTSLIKTNNPECVKNISNFDNKLMHLLSADEHVSKDYPPTFIWTTKTDDMVNPDNVIWLVDALRKKKVKNKCIIYSSGPHGLALANNATSCDNPEWLNIEVSKWPYVADKFIRSIKEKK